MQADNERELTSWKEIAEFLGVSVRTAQRYESELGLPVRRVGGERGRAVVAEVKNLVDWKNRVALAPPWWNGARFLRWYSAVVTVLCLVLAGAVTADWIERSRVGPPHDSHWVNSTLVVTDEGGREVWHRAFDYAPHSAYRGPRYHGDLNGDGQREVVVPWIPEPRDEVGSILYVFSNRGQALWRLAVTKSASDRRMAFSSIYVLREYHVFDSPEKDGTRWIAATFVHHHEYPSVLVVADGNGKVRGEYWHSGHLDAVTTVDVNKDGVADVLVAGTSKALSQAVIRVFDPRKLPGVEQLPADHPNQLMGVGTAGAGKAEATVKFARSRLNRERQQFNHAYWIGPVTTTNTGQQIFQVNVRERLSPDEGYLIYTLRSDLTLESVVASQSLIRTYTEYSLRDPESKPWGERDEAEMRAGYAVVVR